MKRSEARRPFVTLTYAQSLDGALCGEDGSRLFLSGRESTAMTHALRAANQAILVGIGTVLSDDPQLTVRFAEGVNPRPVVIDPRLRLPPDSFLAARHPLNAWIMTAASAPRDREAVLVALGHRVFRFPEDGTGRIDLAAVCAVISGEGIRTLMVEGGIGVIDGFLTAGLVDRVVVTVTPRYTGGRKITGGGGLLPKLENVVCRQAGDDVIIEGIMVRK